MSEDEAMGRVGEKRGRVGVWGDGGWDGAGMQRGHTCSRRENDARQTVSSHPSEAAGAAPAMDSSAAEPGNEGREGCVERGASASAMQTQPAARRHQGQ